MFKNRFRPFLEADGSGGGTGNPAPADPPAGDPAPADPAPALDISKLAPPTGDPAPAEPDVTIESLKAQLAAVEKEKAKFKDSFDKAARERAAAEKAAKEAAAAAAQPAERVAELEKQIAQINREKTKSSLTFSMAEDIGVGREHLEKMAAALFPEETTDILVDDYKNAFRDFVIAAKAQFEKAAIEKYERELLAGRKPQGVGKPGETDQFLEAFNASFRG